MAVKEFQSDQEARNEESTLFRTHIIKLVITYLKNFLNQAILEFYGTFSNPLYMQHDYNLNKLPITIESLLFSGCYISHSSLTLFKSILNPKNQATNFES